MHQTLGILCTSTVGICKAAIISFRLSCNFGYRRHHAVLCFHVCFVVTQMFLVMIVKRRVPWMCVAKIKNDVSKNSDSTFCSSRNRPMTCNSASMAPRLSKCWAQGVLKPRTSSPAQHPDIGVRKPLPHINLSKRWKRLTVVSPKKPLFKCRRVCFKTSLVEVMKRELILDEFELIKKALENGDYT